ncbi:polysaccharide deacetylase family protein [Neobacillus cucumis]|uniref:Polysaccharide deacetylase n=1 Tax=Neobacillus cucumis TaxID=1740721 RepID=A0A2N5HB85_9BACI|nr:polysaccharide deacetylase family protein [Neobacillus cucumis]PLS02750.1 polysaccharide deacetylase [Neobacillus cucumis]
MKKLFILLLGIFVLLLPNSVSAAQRVPILIYHSIAEFSGTGSKELYVTPENFEKQIVYLKDHGFTLLTFEQWQEVKNVKKPIFLTFDDGYKNNLNVLSIFQKLKTRDFKPKGTIFVISDFIGRQNRLSRAEMKQMNDSGLISIQSHTSTHPDLTKTNDLTYELKNSQEKIQGITGKKVIALAYPFGNTNNRVITETKKYYWFGLTTTPEPYNPTRIKDELYLLPRIYVKYSTGIKEFANIVEVNKP